MRRVTRAGQGWLPAGDIRAVTRDDRTLRGGIWRLPDRRCVVEEEEDFAGVPFSPLSTVAADATADGRRAVYATRSADRPGESLWVLESDGTQRRRLRDVNTHLLHGVNFGGRRLGQFRTTDGEEVAARLRLPPGWVPGTRCPTVVVVYPGDHPSHAPNAFAGGGVLPGVVLAAHGYAVLEPDTP